MYAQLERNYRAALADAFGRGAGVQVRELEVALQGTVATINVGAKLLRNMSLGQNYMSYYVSLQEGARHIAERDYHAHRTAVDAKIHTGYEANIVNAALSADGRGLTNYGPITLELQSVAIEDRASVMRENSFLFYERNNLGDRKAQEEPGWRSVWSERARLGVAHLAQVVSAATARPDLVGIIMTCGPDRPQDRYMEVHIFNEVSWQSLSRITLEKALTDTEDQEDWDEGRQRLSSRGVLIVDLVRP